MAIPEGSSRTPMISEVLKGLRTPTRQGLPVPSDEP